MPLADEGYDSGAATAGKINDAAHSARDSSPDATLASGHFPKVEVVEVIHNFLQCILIIKSLESASTPPPMLQVKPYIWEMRSSCITVV